jgi:hypothetical protein
MKFENSFDNYVVLERLEDGGQLDKLRQKPPIRQIKRGRRKSTG